MFPNREQVHPATEGNSSHTEEQWGAATAGEEFSAGSNFKATLKKTERKKEISHLASTHSPQSWFAEETCSWSAPFCATQGPPLSVRGSAAWTG